MGDTSMFKRRGSGSSSVNKMSRFLFQSTMFGPVSLFSFRMVARGENDILTLKIIMELIRHV